MYCSFPSLTSLTLLSPSSGSSAFSVNSSMSGCTCVRDLSMVNRDALRGGGRTLSAPGRPSPAWLPCLTSRPLASDRGSVHLLLLLAKTAHCRTILLKLSSVLFLSHQHPLSSASERHANKTTNVTPDYDVKHRRNWKLFPLTSRRRGRSTIGIFFATSFKISLVLVPFCLLKDSRFISASLTFAKVSGLIKLLKLCRNHCHLWKISPNICSTKHVYESNQFVWRMFL